MTTIDRTAYPRFKRALSERDLREVYTLTEDERTFIETSVYGEQAQLNLALLLKSCQRLAYFPDVKKIPKRIVNHLRHDLQISSDVSIGYEWQRTLYRHHTLVRDYLDVRPYGEGGEIITETAMRKAVQSMMYPADLINVAIEELVRQSYLLPAFSTLNRLAVMFVLEHTINTSSESWRNLRQMTVFCWMGY